MTALATAEAKLRDLAGYRGLPGKEQFLTGDECRLIAEELDALRARLQKGEQDGKSEWFC